MVFAWFHRKSLTCPIPINEGGLGYAKGQPVCTYIAKYAGLITTNRVTQGRAGIEANQLQLARPGTDLVNKRHFQITRLRHTEILRLGGGGLDEQCSGVIFRKQVALHIGSHLVLTRRQGN